MKTAVRWGLRLTVAACAAAATYLGEESTAAAQVNFGVEAGVAARSNTEARLAGGAHIELNPIFGLHIGAYFMHFRAGLSDPPHPAQSSLQFNTLGARLRYIFNIPGAAEWKPFLLAGVGQTWVDFPTYSLAPSGVINPQTSAELGRLDRRSGRFIEVPLGLGIGYQPLKPFMIDVGFAYRPGFSFKGDAYEPPPGLEADERAKGGWSATLGLSMGI